LQSGVVGADGQEIVEVSLIPSSGKYPVAEILAGEEIVSLRALFQKPGLVKADFDNIFTIDNGDAEFNHWGPGDPEVGGGTYIDWYGTCFLGMAGSTRIKLLIDKASIKHNASSIIKTPLRAVPMIGYANGGMGLSYPVSEMCPTITEDTLTAELTIPYYWNEKYIPAYGKQSERPGDHLIWSPDANLRFEGMLYKSAGPDLRLTYFRCQNSFSFFGDPLYPVNEIWSSFEIGPFAPPPTALKISGEIEEGESSGPVADEIPLNLYMARTGRRERKPPHTRVSFMQRSGVRKQAPSRVTQRDVVVASVPPLRPASRRRIV